MCSIVIILELIVSMSEFQTGFCTLQDEPTESGLYRLSIRGVVIAITASSVMLSILWHGDQDFKVHGPLPRSIQERVKDDQDASDNSTL